jgi:hypothetical protein
MPSPSSNMSKPAHRYPLRPNVRSRLGKRIEETAAASESPDIVIGKPTTPCLRRYPRRGQNTPKADIDMDSSDGESQSQCGSDADSDSEIDSSEPSASPSKNMSSSSVSGSGFASDTDSAEPNTPHRKQTRPSSALDTPRPRRRTEDRQRPKGYKAGTVASPDARVEDSLASVAGRRRGRHSSEGTKDIEAVRSRVAARRREDAKRIRIEQIKKQLSSEAWTLRQRAADLEREAEEEAARLARALEEKDKEKRSESGSESTAMEEDRDEVLSNHSYAPTEVYSDSEQERWTRAPPTHQQEGGVALHRHHAVPMVIEPSQPQPFITVTREVQGFDDVTGSPVQKVKRYRVRPEDLESLHSDSDMEEL